VNIAIDLRALASEQISGVTVYLRAVLQELIKLDQQSRYFLWWNSPTAAPPDLNLPKNQRVQIVYTRHANRLLNLRLRLGKVALDELILSAAGQANAKLDLFWLPDPRPVALSPDCALIATIHDLASEMHPEFFNLKTRLWHRWLAPQKIAKMSDQILAVSRFTSSELQKKWRVPNKKITVTPLGVARDLRPVKDLGALAKVRRKYDLPAKFALSLCTLEPRKNLATLVRAFEILKTETDLPHALVLAGSYDAKIFADPKIKNCEPWLHLPGRIAETDKAALMSAANCFCVPSLYEGFGLPALEALQVSTPLLAADIPALREVAGRSAKFIAPRNADAWAQSLRQVLTDTKLIKKMQLTGRQQAFKFTWQKTAEKTLQAFEKVAAERGKFTVEPTSAYRRNPAQRSKSPSRAARKG
jgi:glycosyltransferase involved in cell wall biosynthesis